MELKDRIEALQLLAKIQREQFLERRKIEYRVLFTTLTFFVSCVVAVYQLPIDISNWPCKWLIWLAFILFAWVVWMYLYTLGIGNTKNTAFAETAENNIGKLLDCDTLDKLSPFNAQPKPIKMWLLLWQAVTLFLFAIGASLLISIKQAQP